MPGGDFFAHVGELAGGEAGGHVGKHGAASDFHESETVGNGSPFEGSYALGNVPSKRDDIRQVTAFSDF